MSSPIPQSTGRARQWVGFMATPTGAILGLSAAASLWAVLGRGATRPAAAVAVLLGFVFLLQKFTAMTAQIRRLSERLTAMEARVGTRIVKANARIDRTSERIETNKRRILRATSLARETGAVLRAEIAGSRLEEKEWAAVDVGGVPDPILSIAVPGYNRPEALQQCLQSIVEQIEPDFADTVEVIVTDDRSTDRGATEVAHSFALDHPFIGFRRNHKNIGLERNLIQCAEPCRGEYLWVFGNDDVLGPDALSPILDDLRSGAFDILVYNKERMTKYGGHEAFRPGTMPVELPPGEQQVFSSMLEVGRLTGLISTFGWITQVIRRREPCMAVNPEPFYNTTLHPHLGTLMVAYPRSPVAYRNLVAVIHRTQDPRQRLAEGAGRPEASYMAGGMERDSCWFGAGYAAMLQRVIDRSDIEPAELLDQQEALWSDLSLLNWIATNWQHGLKNRLELPEDILADAERLFESLGLKPPAILGH